MNIVTKEFMHYCTPTAQVVEIETELIIAASPQSGESPIEEL